MKKIIAVFAFIVFFTACKKKEALGPDIDGIYGPVTVTQPFSASTTSVNFTSGEKVFFNASFQNDAVWIITISGSNGAQKVITGIGKEITATNSTWDGTATLLPSFIAGSATATLTFNNDAQTVNIPLTISAKRISDLATDVLVSSFLVNKRHYNGGPACGGCTIGWTAPYGWPSDYPNISNTDMTYPKPDGNNYLILSGTPWAPPGKTITPYVNFLTIMADSSDFRYGKYFPLYADPAKVYFNIMICGTNTPYSHLQVNIIEEGTNGDVTRTIDYRPNWTGWKLFSYKYSDLAVGSAEVPNPQKVKGIQLLLLSDVPTLPGVDVKVGIDHMTFTHNKPYQP